MDIAKKIAEELEIKVTQVEAAVKLIDEGVQSLLLQDTERKLQER